MFVTPEQLTRSNIRQSKSELKALASLLTEEIQRRGVVPSGWDFRFFLPQAQWLIEQGGYTMTPEGNNPGNVVETGDDGTFTREKNQEVRGGVMKAAPEVKFARYSTMKVATARKFDLLRDKWPLAYQAVLTGGSADAFATGLYVGGGKDYATAPLDTKTGADGKKLYGYRPGMRLRLKQVVAHYILAAEDDLKEMGELEAAIPATAPAPGVSLDYRNDRGLNKNMRTVLENLLVALQEVKKRVDANQRVQT